MPLRRPKVTSKLFNANGKGLPKWFDIFDQMTVIEGDRKLGDGMSVVGCRATPLAHKVFSSHSHGYGADRRRYRPHLRALRGDESRRHIPNDLAVDLDAYPGPMTASTALVARWSRATTSAFSCLWSRSLMARRPSPRAKFPKYPNAGRARKALPDDARPRLFRGPCRSPMSKKETVSS